MPDHSVALMLLCWKSTIRGDERRRDWYCLWSWDLRNSGGLCDGGCVGGYRDIGGTAETVCSIGGAGVVALAREACRHCQQMYGLFARGTAGRSLLGWKRTRGGILEGCSALIRPQMCDPFGATVIITCVGRVMVVDRQDVDVDTPPSKSANFSAPTACWLPEDSP